MNKWVLIGLSLLSLGYSWSSVAATEIVHSLSFPEEQRIEKQPAEAQYLAAQKNCDDFCKQHCKIKRCNQKVLQCAALFLKLI